MSEIKKWQSYEEVASYLLDQFAHEFGLIKVEGKQVIKGKRSKASYEIDAKGVRDDDSIFIIVECRRYTKSKQNQEKLNALAYRIIDSGADGGILVSPLGFQKGAKRVASEESIMEVMLDENSSTTDYFLKFLNKIHIGLSEAVKNKEEVSFLMKCTICGYEHTDIDLPYYG